MKVIIIALVLFISGCTVATVKTPDCEASYTSVFRSVDSAKLSGCGVKGEAENADPNTTLITNIIKELSRN